MARGTVPPADCTPQIRLMSTRLFCEHTARSPGLRGSASPAQLPGRRVCCGSEGLSVPGAPSISHCPALEGRTQAAQGPQAPPAGFGSSDPPPHRDHVPPARPACLPSSPSWLRLREHKADCGSSCSVDFQGPGWLTPAGSWHIGTSTPGAHVGLSLHEEGRLAPTSHEENTWRA